MSKKAEHSRVGRPEWEPTEEQRASIESMAGVGVPHEDIAKVIGVDAKTLRKHCSEQLDLGAIKANAKVSESLYKKALGDGPSAVAAGIWWEKTRQGRKDTTRHQHEGPNGGPMQIIDLSKASDEQLLALEAIFGPIAAGHDGDGGDQGGTGEASG